MTIPSRRRETPVPPAANSRFAGLPVLSVVTPDGGQRHVIALRLILPRLVHVDQYQLREGEGVDLIAARLYGDEGLWWRLLDGNPVRFPLDVSAGDVLELTSAAQATVATRARAF